MSAIGDPVPNISMPLSRCSLRYSLAYLFMASLAHQIKPGQQVWRPRSQGATRPGRRLVNNAAIVYLVAELPGELEEAKDLSGTISQAASQAVRARILLVYPCSGRFKFLSALERILYALSIFQPLSSMVSYELFSPLML